MAAAQPKPAEQIKRTAQAVEQHSRKVADSAAETKHAAAAIETSADLNTRLAADRNVLAAERTYAAWGRTGLFALASAIGARAVLAGGVPGGGWGAPGAVRAGEREGRARVAGRRRARRGGAGDLHDADRVLGVLLRRGGGARAAPGRAAAGAAGYAHPARAADRDERL